MISSIVTYPPDGVKPVGIIEFVHGMTEHKERYRKTMERFSERGFICAAMDMRGHGNNVLTEDDLGYFGKEGYKGMVDDISEYTSYLQREYPGLPIILIGHSMGSLLVRAYLKKNSRYVDAVVLSGSPSMRHFTFLGKLLIQFIKLFKGERYRSMLITKLTLGPYENAFKNEGTLNAWVCSDRDIVDDFNADPKSGFIFTLNGYLNLTNLQRSVYSKNGWRFKDRDLPIMFVSGANDPCRINDNVFKKSVNFLKHRGFKNVYYNLYEDMRHEVFSEPDNEEVYEDIIKFLEVKGEIDIKSKNKSDTFSLNQR